jgi:hypothetical protein
MVFFMSFPNHDFLSISCFPMYISVAGNFILLDLITLTLFVDEYQIMKLFFMLFFSVFLLVLVY